MHVDPQALRLTAIVVIILLLYGSRLTAGSARQTPEGMVFGMKPFVVVSRIIVFALYLGFLAYQLHTSGTNIPIWYPALFLLAVGISLLQFPGTIVLGPESIRQRFWFLKERVIAYSQVITLQGTGAGRAIRVLGDNRVIVTHTNNYSAADVFRIELERRTGKTIQT